jgi:hypothetical protein
VIALPAASGVRPSVSCAECSKSTDIVDRFLVSQTINEYISIDQGRRVLYSLNLMIERQHGGICFSGVLSPR